ncbi:hypothetical protein [Cohnella terricola]|uniref:Spore germination protein n=1 Tax=Cohnella terricola TaxID=1289167 RepID=A0A559JBS1_9BACL|nr:hypothetical protein [Cohnella terricola]TVX97311.1 hypothetical protein FPZ45_18395 [Cohnella terricola]
MSRYFYYHVLYVGLINIMIFVPWTLFQNRFHGAVSAMAIAIVIGTIMAWTTTSLFLRFPEMALSDIVKAYFPRGIALIVNVIGAIIWGFAGILVVYAYSSTIQQFFNPDMNPYLFLLLMTAAGVWGATRCSRTIQFAHEVLMLLCTPLILMILFKAIFSPWLDWDAIRVSLGYVRTRPSLNSLSAALFVFAGYNTLVIFNRLIPANTKIRQRWIIPVFCSFFLFVSFFIPIGFHGTVGVADYLYVWSITSDSMIMQYGFVYRVLYVFLLLYTALSLMFTMNTWHTAMEFIKACHPRYTPQPDQYPVKAVNWWITISFAVLTFAYAAWANDQRNQLTYQSWLIVRSISEVVVLLILVWCFFVSRRKRRSSIRQQTAAQNS